MRPGRRDFPWFIRLETRWGDNDVYGHVNNVQYYSWFDTAVNRWLIEQGLLDPVASPAIGLVVETRCRYFAPVSFPEAVDVGLSVVRLGRSSVGYEIGIFRAGAGKADAGEIVAPGEFTHVYVDRAARRPVKLRADVRAALQMLQRA